MSMLSIVKNHLELNDINTLMFGYGRDGQRLPGIKKHQRPRQLP